MAELTHKSMIPIPISELIAGIKIPVDIFVRLGDAKFVLLARANTVTQKDQLRTYEGKEVEYLWVKNLNMDDSHARPSPLPELY